MSDGTLTIFNASAGSGKTYTLTGIYLSSLFKGRFNYRKILAVTFTNKATSEMKNRIIESLHKLAAGKDCEYLKQLMSETGKSEEWIRKEAAEILNSILHDFSRFSVSTIDSFFQKIIRAFARETGLRSSFNIELDHNALLTAAIDEMIASASGNEQLKRWLISYAVSNIDEEKSWDIRKGIADLSQELFREKFKILSDSERLKLEDKEFLQGYIASLKTIVTSFEKQMMEAGSKALAVFNEYDLTDEMFYYKSRGVPGYIRRLAKGDICKPNDYVRAATGNSPKWSSNGVDPNLQNALNNHFGEIISGLIILYDQGAPGYNTASAILKNIYALGILSDVLGKIREQTSAGNIFLLSDAGEFLSLITGADQSPFIYEKVGNTFENFMIDEFQDTSMIQWNNFNPLIDNSLAQGFDNLVVGDIKQSIYRWRNSDWRILSSMLGKSDGKRLVAQSLATNYRSRSGIISFNNSLFTVIPALLDERTNSGDLFSGIYSEAMQSDPGKKPGGYVRVEFLESDEETKWEQKALGFLPGIIKRVQDNGFRASDIGIIVRNGNEGSAVLNTLITYFENAAEEEKKLYNFSVVSNDSLLLSNSPAVNLIVSVLTFANDPGNMISLASMLRFWLLATGAENASDVSLSVESADSRLPEDFRKFAEDLKQIPVFEAIERIISFFHLSCHDWNEPYLNTFQDCVLSFITKGNADFKSFLDWWEIAGRNKSVVLPGNQDAMRILTIHKSKGLEFKVVILPFVGWHMEHSSSHQPLLWIRPEMEPFNQLGIVPVRCNKDLEETYFSSFYTEESQAANLDNLNLLYVAATRAVDALFCFSDAKPGSNSIAGIFREAFLSNRSNGMNTNLAGLFNPENNIFESGELPRPVKLPDLHNGISSSGYHVNHSMGSLRLKLHGENYFSTEEKEIRARINYGKLMHEIFEGIDTAKDIGAAVRRLVLEGKLPEAEAGKMEEKVRMLIGVAEVSEWFSSENKVLKETGILLTSGNIRRPDRVIFRDGKATIIDFKFGRENEKYAEQVSIYRSLLAEMGYREISAHIWYVDQDKIITV